MVLLLTFSVVTAGVGQKLVLLCVMSAIIHETGHLFFICKYKGKPDSVVVNLFEIRILTDSQPIYRWKEIVIAFAGIASNLMTSLMSCVLYRVYPIGMFLDFALCNLFVAIMNMLPIQSFDGGQLLYLTLSAFIADKYAYRAVFILSVLLLFPVAFLSIFVLFTSQHNYSLLFVFLYLLSIFISKELR